jgi:hypothetical protein
MSAYCFFDIQAVMDQQKLARYREGVFATVEQFGGPYLVLGGKTEIVEGSWRPVTPHRRHGEGMLKLGRETMPGRATRASVTRWRYVPRTRYRRSRQLAGRGT